MQHYVINFIRDLRQVGGFLRVLRFPPPMSSKAFSFPSVMEGFIPTMANPPVNISTVGQHY
jgi:hypothetical protein